MLHPITPWNKDVNFTEMICQRDVASNVLGGTAVAMVKIRTSNITNSLAGPIEKSLTLLVIDDTTSMWRREGGVATSCDEDHGLFVRLHLVENNIVTNTRTLPLVLDVDNSRHGKRRSSKALELISDEVKTPCTSIVVAGSEYGASQDFAPGLVQRGLDFMLELLPSTKVVHEGSRELVSVATLLASAKVYRWKEVTATHPTTKQTVRYACNEIGVVTLINGTVGHLYVIQTGAIHGVHRGTIFLFTSIDTLNYSRAIAGIGWSRWIKPFLRQQSRPIRQNVTITDRSLLDLKSLPQPSLFDQSDQPYATTSTLNIVELFAGAGGMGLGFLMANGAENRYRILFSGEVHPVYVKTLKQNHNAYVSTFRRGNASIVPSQYAAIDLRTKEAFELAKASVVKVGRPDILIGGPPCQGFSNANRNSGHGGNRNNRLVDTYVEYVKQLSPKIFIMENVQGILSSAKLAASTPLSVLEYVAVELKAAGYLVFPKLVDAAWFGVPQHRQRFFVIGIHDDLGYSKGDFSPWGPFPVPTHGPDATKRYVTVRDAIADLPPVSNGAREAVMPYHEPTEADLSANEFLAVVRHGATANHVNDHLTSRHADYVLERYKLIPEGGNWQSIVEHLSNYANVDRTHSNIYRRLLWDSPSITIGHYRKSMLIHPSQDRGLSLREASRLQSFPDWFRFAGAANGEAETLGHKQQQLANAVCPLVSKAIAEYVYKLIVQSNCGAN